MPASTKKSARPTAKRVARAMTKTLDRKPATKRGPALLETLMNKPFTDARNAKPASKPTKATKPAPAATAVEKPAAEPTGAKATVIAMIAATKAGVSAAEIATKLGWPRAGGTISRAIKLASFKVAKVRGDDGVLRYSHAG